MKDALGELSNALRLSADRRRGHPGPADHHHAQPQLAVRRRRRPTTRRCESSGPPCGQLGQILADENLGTGTTGKKLNEVITQVGEVLDTHRDTIKQIVANGRHRTDDHGRSSARSRRVPRSHADDAGQPLQHHRSARTAPPASTSSLDKVLFDTQAVKEVCNMMGLRQLGCSTGTIAGLRTRLRPVVHARRPRGDGAEMMAIAQKTPSATGDVRMSDRIRLCHRRVWPACRCPPRASAPAATRLTAVFSNALNLPASAKVKLAGADVGELESMVARNYTAVTTLRIMDGVRLPKGSTAELRSATPLGDVFVALKPPGPTASGHAAAQGRRHHRPGVDQGRRHRRVRAQLGRDPGQRRRGAQLHQHHQRSRQGDRRPGPGVRRSHRARPTTRWASSTRAPTRSRPR